MTDLKRYLLAGVVIASLSACGSGTDEVAGAGYLTITDAWSPLAPSTVNVAAGYFVASNLSSDSVTIVEATSPAYSEVALHRSFIEDGLVHMGGVNQISVEAGDKVEFSPGGLHLMLKRPDRRYSVGDQFPVSLHFSNGENVTFNMQVKRREQAANEATGLEMDHSHHGH
ncbi:copper chaperone PCu(A)C [Marinimicrobium sp. ABcell2]|uniref:copper chaperone PCu(A)C n=1 Tax=Marinimicrobium sp. ABcell2 TaxID=3069751 RepID=UPI0027B1967D|nr:copper chaperone PCu(A)C [Marinimicrobium sp. ABcell2]MDQ2078043.1 copper chaperone PCu(A)C [Marinimicrobium sp. ABcell2]